MSVANSGATGTPGDERMLRASDSTAFDQSPQAGLTRRLISDLHWSGAGRPRPAFSAASTAKR